MIIRCLQWLAWLVYLAGSLLILMNLIADYRPGGDGLFILDKGEIGGSLFWRTSLYIHILGGLVCLFASPPGSSRPGTARRRAARPSQTQSSRRSTEVRLS